MNAKTSPAHTLWITLSCLALVGLVCVSVGHGAGKYGYRDVLSYLSAGAARSFDAELTTVFVELRLARTLAALMIGGGLALSATLLQNITRNPLAEPGLLGVNAGGVLGVVLGLTYFGAESVRSYMVWAGLGAFAANILVLSAGSLARRTSPPHLILIGIATSATLGGLANYILMAHETALEQFRFWNLGSLSGVKFAAVATTFPYFLGAGAATLAMTRMLSLMQLGENQAKCMGVPTRAVTFAVWIVSAVLTAGAIAMAGPIMFAGFLAAYVARLASGARFGLQVLYSWLFGMILLLASDTLARWLIQPFELPVGVVVALVGTPVTVLVSRTRLFRSALVGDHL